MVGPRRQLALHDALCGAVAEAQAGGPGGDGAEFGAVVELGDGAGVGHAGRGATGDG